MARRRTGKLSVTRRHTKDRLVVRIKGKPADGRAVRLTAFIQFLDSFRKLLIDTEEHLTGERPEAYYAIVGLSMRSPATVALEKRVEAGARPGRLGPRRTFDAVVTGYRDLGQGKTPRGFDVDLLLEYADVADYFTRPTGLDEAEILHGRARAKLNPALREQVERVLGPDQCEEGEVSGLLDTVQLHGKRQHFILYPISGTPKRIKCFFGPDVQPTVGEVIKRAAKRHVTVQGMLRFKASSLHPYAVNATRVIQHLADEDLPSFRNLRGIAPNATGGERSEDFVRRLRDGWR